MNHGIDYHFSKKPLMKNEPCADLGVLKEGRYSLFFAIADVAGHGDAAHQISVKIKKYFLKNYKKKLPDLMSGLHIFLKGSRGAVATAGFLHKKTGVVEYVGLGNISVRKFGKKHTRFISNEGVIGYIIPTPRIKRLRLTMGEALLLYTDGISDHFQASECPDGFFDKDAKCIVRGIMKHFNKGNDDAGCIAIRYKND